LSSVFSSSQIRELTQTFIVQTNWRVRVIDGKDFRPDDTGYEGNVPQSLDYLVYHFQKERQTLRDYRLYKCKLENCTQMMMPSLSKFFDHLRSHSKEKPFVCKYGCGKSFSQIGNCNKHMEQIHEKVRKYECRFCKKKFTKKFNL
jgi:hypothetical protein